MSANIILSPELQTRLGQYQQAVAFANVLKDQGKKKEAAKQYMIAAEIKEVYGMKIFQHNENGPMAALQLAWKYYDAASTQDSTLTYARHKANAVFLEIQAIQGAKK